MSKMKTLIKKKETSTDVAVPSMSDWGVSQVSGRDIIIPKILCMQGLSELVADDDHPAVMGDFVDSMTNKIIGNYAKKPIEFIPFHLSKVWIISTRGVNEKEFKYKEIVPVNMDNESQPYNEVVDGIEYQRQYTMNFYCLCPHDMTMPYIISFKGMSSRAGRVLATQMYVRNAAAGKVPPAYVMELGGSKDKNDKGIFITLNSHIKRASTNEEIAEAFKWYKTVTDGGVKVHEPEATKPAPEKQEEVPY